MAVPRRVLEHVARTFIEVIKSHSKKVIASDDCAKEIISALSLKKNEIFIPKRYAVVPMVRSIFKGTVDKLIKAKVDKQLKD